MMGWAKLVCVNPGCAASPVSATSPAVRCTATPLFLHMHGPRGSRNFASPSGDDPPEDLANFGYKLNIKPAKKGCLQLLILAVEANADSDTRADARTREREREMAVGVLALQGSFKEHMACLRKLGVEAVEVRKAEQLEGLAGLIIPGGESTTMAKLAEHYHLFPSLREFGASGKPIWGTCAGLIFLADKAVGQKAGGQDLLGGLDCTVHRNFFGCQLNSFETQLPVPALVSEEGGPSSFRAVFIRAPAITEAGPSVEVLAEYTLPSNFQTSALDQVEGQEELQKVIVAVRQKNLMATAFHPELTSDMRWHRYFLKMVNGGKNLECRKESSMMGLPQVKDLPIFREADHLSFDNDFDQG